MKFSFEKAKDIAKKTAMGAGVITASFGNLEANDKNSNESLDSHKIEVETKNTNYGGESVKEIHYDVVRKTLNNPESLDEKYFNNIKKMELPISEYSKEKPKIMDNSISLLSGIELDGRKDDRKTTIVNNIEVTSELDNRYITNLVLNNLVNNQNNFKILDKSPIYGSDIIEELKLEKEGFVKNGSSFNHIIPEYYFILEQDDDGSAIVFDIKIFSSKDKKIVSEKYLNYQIPKDSSEIKNFVENIAIPNITKEIESEYYNLKNY